MRNTIFVYGTLMEGFRNYTQYIDGHVINIQKGYVKGALYDMPYLDYPALLEGDDRVYGEVITVDDLKKIQPAMDELEGYHGRDDDLYKRVSKTVTLENGETLKLDVYFYHGLKHDKLFKDQATYIPSGDWRQFKEDQE